MQLHPEVNEIYKEYPLTVHPGIGMEVYIRPLLGSTIRLLLGIVALVLVVACANTANLLLFRGMRRRGEFAVRRALGASGGRLLRQHLVEGLVLSTAGGIIGVGLALALLKGLDGQVLRGFPPISDIPIDVRVLGFALMVSLATGLLSGIIPAVSAARRDHLANLKDSSRTTAGGGRRLWATLSIIQIAASMALGVGALLLSRTLVNLYRVELGFEPAGVLGIWIDPGPQGYSAPRLRTLRHHLFDRIASQAGVEAMALTSSMPFTSGYSSTDVRADDDRGASWPVKAFLSAVSPGYFQTLRIRSFAGRDFTSAEFRADSATAPTGVLLSREAARRLFGDGDPTGRRIVQRGSGITASRPVLGVVDDVRSRGVRGEPTPVIYESLSYEKEWRPSMLMLVVRSSRPRADIDAMVRTALAEFDPSLPISRIEPMIDRVAAALAQERLFARLVGMLAGIACVLGAVGLYSLISYGVELRRREIGVRMALGAQTATVVGLIVRQAGALVAAGLVIGTVAAVVLARLLESRLFGVASVDIATYGAAAAVLVGLGIIASAVPARSAARVNPVETLRQD
jgi:predicted permease